MIKRISKSWLVINILGLLAVMVIFLVVQMDFIRKWRVFVVVVSLTSIAQLIFYYEINKKAKLAWVEPKSVTRARSKEAMLSEIRRTSWGRIAIILLLLFLASAYLGQNRLHAAWYRITLVFGVGIAAAAIYGVILFAVMHYMKEAAVYMDEEGIRLGGNDARLRKCLYSKMASITLIPNTTGGYSLGWQYEGKEIIRGISREIDISQIKTLIEKNSNLELKVKDALSIGSTAGRGINL